MSQQANAVVDRFWNEAWIEKSLDTAGEMLDENVVVHNFSTVVKGREAWKQTMGAFHTGIPDMVMTV